MGNIPVKWRLEVADFLFFLSIHRHDTREVASLCGNSPQEMTSCGGIMPFCSSIDTQHTQSNDLNLWTVPHVMARCEG